MVFGSKGLIHARVLHVAVDTDDLSDRGQTEADFETERGGGEGGEKVRERVREKVREGGRRGMGQICAVHGMCLCTVYGVRLLIEVTDDACRREEYGSFVVRVPCVRCLIDFD